MNIIRKIYDKLSRKPLLVKPVVSCSFIEGETVTFDDGYNKYKVVIQGIWQDMATIVYEDGLTYNTHIGNLSKNCN